MSQCPYGARAVYPLANLRSEIDSPENVQVRYILDYDETTDEFRSLHGESEIAEDIRQITIREYFPDKYWCYVQSRGEHFFDTLWIKDAMACGLDTARLNEMVVNHGRSLTITEAKNCERLDINASPTLLIDGIRAIEWGGDFASLAMLVRNGIPGSLPDEGLPECFDEGDCLPESNMHTTRCVDNRCVSERLPEVHMTIVRPDTVFGDPSKEMVKIFKSIFRGLIVNYIEHGTKEADDFEKILSLDRLPAYVFDTDVQNVPEFERVRDNLITVRNGKDLWYQVKPHTVYSAFYMNRPRHPGELAVFVMSECPFSKAVEESLFAQGRTNNIVVHFIGRVDSTGEIYSLHGKEEIEENKRQAVLQRFFPSEFWPYLSCRNKADNPFNCLDSISVTESDLRQYVFEYGDSLLLNDVSLCESLNVRGSPTFLWENQYILHGPEALLRFIGISLTGEKCNDEIY